ncbi:hypothetical protein EZS27_012783 [termite gut metagenome]|uniref:Uncharacterized protein n=1 Tax=termite gut metagenome TaxID=433724 RepID=A0A5J4S199_9ZZZZ
MNDASFKIFIEREIPAFLKKMDLFKGKGVKKIGDHSDEFKKISRKNIHTELYSVAIKNLDYEILLSDDSIFQFSKNQSEFRYAFIQTPYINVSKEDFINLQFTHDELSQLNKEEYDDFVNTIREEDFEQFRCEQSINPKSHIIRYDIDKKNYLPLIHAYSHLHIGPNDYIRIPCSILLTPLSFAQFVIKNTYPINHTIYIQHIAHKGDKIDSKFWKGEEEREVFFI